MLKDRAKPPMPANLKATAAKAVKRHQQRLLSPGVAVEVVKAGEPYVVSSPHKDSAGWEAMVCDALGTRSVSTAQTFLGQLTELCSQNWHPSEVEGEYGQWCPDEGQLNLILNMVGGIKPRNELEAAQAAQMVAVHLMTMRVSAQALRGAVVAPQDAAIAGKLARTFVMQADGLAKLRVRKPSSRQTITVKTEKHLHTHQHQHVHVEGGGPKIGEQCHESGEGSRVRARRAAQLEGCTSMPSYEPSGEVVPLRRCEGQAGLSPPRRTSGGTKR